MTGELFELTLEGSRDPVSGKLQNKYILPRTLIVPKNSNIQIVYDDVVHSIERAKRFKPPFREYAIAMAEADLQGMIAISSEQGAFVREFNTVRSSIPMGQVQGQPATWFDDYVYGKEKLKNNPKAKEDGGLGLGIGL